MEIYGKKRAGHSPRDKGNGYRKGWHPLSTLQVLFSGVLGLREEAEVNSNSCRGAQHQGEDYVVREAEVEVLQGSSRGSGHCAGQIANTACHT